MAQFIWLSYTGMKPPESDARNSRSSNCFEPMAKTPTKQLVVCTDNDGYPASLERRKIYVALRDAGADKHGLLRIVDESGEDNLYPKTYFPCDSAAASSEESCSGGRLASSRFARSPHP
jgi:hypothetical protein